MVTNRELPATGTPAITPDSILAALQAHNLLSAEAIGRARAAVRAAGNPNAIFQALLDAGLTRFQARVAVSGQAARLVFGPYILLDKIGSGGMGVVYKARLVRLGRVDAVKLVRADKSESRTLAKRFLREIQLTSSLEHPHVVRAHDAGLVGRQLYLATEFVDGTDLATLVQTRGPLSVADACLVTYQAALALQHVHEKGLVHRDLKPSNLIRDRVTRAVKVLDLGLSGFNRANLKPVSAATLTRDGVVLGTPDFMAPEQVQDPHTVDIRADLYSLGCTFYFLLTGRLPYDGTPVEKLYRHGFAPPPTLTLPRGCTPPPGLSEIILRLMAKRPEDRYQNPQQLIDALLALRPGSGGNADTGSVSTLTRTPAPAADLVPGDFDNLMSSIESRDEADLPPRPEPHGGWVPGWLIAVGIWLLFGVGFLSAALYFSGKGK